MIAITRLCTVDGLNRKWESHNSGNIHSVHHAHRSPWRKPPKSTTRAKTLKNSQVIPQALRAPGTLPARNSGSKSTVVGEMVTSRAAKRPKMALIRRTA